MEWTNSRLYSGPLSQPAQKILAFLRAQNPCSARCSHSNSNNHRQPERYYGSQREHQAQSSRCEEERRERHTDGPWYRPRVSSLSSSYFESSNQTQGSHTLAYYQHSHTPDYSPPSQASSSSSYWDSSLQRQSCRTRSHCQHSQTYSQRAYSQPTDNQSRQRQLSQATVSSHTDRYTLVLQTPERISLYQTAHLRNPTEEMRTSFIFSQGSDEAFFPITEHPKTNRKPASACHPVPSRIKISDLTDNHTSVAPKAIWSQDTVASDVDSNGMLLLSNLSEVPSTGEEDGDIYRKSASGAIKTERLRLPSSGNVTRLETGYDTSVPNPTRQQGRNEGTRQMLDIENLMEAGGGHMSYGEQEMHDGANEVACQEMGHGDAALQKEKRPNKEMEVIRLRTNGNANLQKHLLSLCATNAVDTQFDCDPEGMKEEENDSEHGVNASESKGLQNQLGIDNKEISVGNHTDSPEKVSISVEREMADWQAENPQEIPQTEKEDGERHHHTEDPREQMRPIELVLGDIIARNMERTTEDRVEVMVVGLEVEGSEASLKEEMETEKTDCKEGDDLPGYTESGRNEPMMTAMDSNTSPEDLGTGSYPTPTSQDVPGSEFRALCLHEDENLHTGNGNTTGSGSNIDLTQACPSTSGQHSSLNLDLAWTSIAPSGRLERSNLLSPNSHSFSHQPPLIPSFPLKRKHEVLQTRNASPPPKITITRRHPKWEPPCSSQGRAREGVWNQKEITSKSSTSAYEHSGMHPTSATEPQAKDSKIEKMLAAQTDACALDKPRSRRRMESASLEERAHGSATNPHKQTASPTTSQPPKQVKRGPDQAMIGPKQLSSEPQNQTKTASLTTALTSDPRVKDCGKLNAEERVRVLEEAGQAEVLVLTMVYQDGSTQLDPEQKPVPAVCGLLLLMKNDLDRSAQEDTPGPNDSLVYLKLEHTPAWAQQHRHHSQELFTRDMLLHILSSSQLVVCYKAKDLLRTALQFYRQDLNWKQVLGCHIQDPHVSGWLLDPADPSSCYQDLLAKHCRRPRAIPALGTLKVSQVISGLSSLYRLNTDLRSKLQSQGLWDLYSHMELNMIPVLAVMESHRIHVDKEALKRTSDILGTKMKQLEQEAHQAAGQIFLVTSNTQLREVLFEKLRLHERCENKKLPKTVNKQQQSTSEAALLKLQDLHPLPKIILEHRQVHKIKSTFVDGILSCMMSKNYISSTWHQTSAVTGRISAKHPNFQALPRQPLQITKKHNILGKEEKEEVVTVHPRAMFIPQEGWTFLAADFCQVELRLLAHLSSDPELLRIFTNPQADVFTMLASQWKGVSEGEVTSKDREHAKRIVYSVVYGAGRERLSGILGVSAEQASQFQDSFLKTYREIQAFIQSTIQQCHKQGYVLSIMGRRRTLPHINSPDWRIRMQAERQAVNFVVQGSAADLCKMAMIRIFNQVSSSSSLSARLIAQLHDELLYEVEDSQVEQFAALVKRTMESLQHIDCMGVCLKVPLKVAVSSGKSWGSMSELSILSASPSPSL
ncbi:hypothetical protein LDENG_00175690 [Lucifuga dentata]|nr:hypothetical protein LDENG_00175690 [Lucifuga dentata]